MTHDGEPDSYEYASRLATWIWEKHYKNESPHWKPLNDLLGVLTQIDNMTTGLVRAQPEPEPVATVYDAYDATGIDWHCKDAPSTGTKLYTAPPQREFIGLTEAERIDIIDEEITAQSTEHFALAQAIEAKLKEKNT